jgi:hypothetical protein
MNICDGIGINRTNADMLSILMIGQSNMCGRGNLHEVPQIENPACYMMRMGRWQPMSDPINVDRAIEGIPYPSGVSLAGSFADELSRYTGKDVGLIPCADGGTKVESWLPGKLLFDHAVMQCRLAMRTSTLAGIIWHQGESNANTDPAIYKKRVLSVFEGLRRELGMPDLPIVAGEISENCAPRWEISKTADRINGVYRELERELPFFALASSKDLSLKDDGIHFSSTSLREFGVRYFKKFITIYK